MKFIVIALLVGACLTVTWPSVSGTKTLGSPMTIKAGQTYDGKASNGGKWIRFERGRSGLGDLKMVLPLVLNSMLKVVLLEMEVIKSSNTIQLVLYTLIISIVKIQENFTELVEIAKKDIKEKGLFL